MGAGNGKVKNPDVSPVTVQVQPAQMPAGANDEVPKPSVPAVRSRSPLAAAEARKRDQEIEQKLLLDKNQQNVTVKLLLLGGGESGKSTIAKQMKILHSNGFDETELINIRYIAQNNVLNVVDDLFQGIKQLASQIQLTHENKEDLQTIIMFKSNQQLVFSELNEEIGGIIKRFWLSPAAQICYENRHRIELVESAKFFMDNVERISASDYVPTSEDAIRCRLATTGVHEIRFQFRNRHFRLIDVGGQRSERRKWIRCFDDVTAILFVTSLAEYNQTLMEDDDMKRVDDSLELFNKIANNKNFAKIPIILFLNKKDVFEEKIQRYPISDYFPSYQGKPGSYDEAAEFIREMYRERNPKEKQFYAHYTNATDTRNVEVVFTACMDIVLKKNMAAAGVF